MSDDNLTPGQRARAWYERITGARCIPTEVYGETQAVEISIRGTYHEPSFYRRVPTDEGWHSESIELVEIDPETDSWEVRVQTSERDCDGLMDREAVYTFRPGGPDADSLDRSQRDHAAEAMGY